MFKLTNAQAQAFLSPALTDLYKRSFPTETAFRLADILRQIQTISKIYQDQARKIILANSGKIDADGHVTYEDSESGFAAAKELETLNDLEIELTGDKLDLSNDWPNLNLREAVAIRPLLSSNGSNQDAEKS